MPRPDRVTLNDKLAMPPVDDLSNRGLSNVLVERLIKGVPTGLSADRSLVGLFVNFARLTDKALREYDAARAELLLMLEPHEQQLRVTPYTRAIDHMENCLSALHRAVLNAKALRAQGLGRGAPQLTERQFDRLNFVRNAVEHSDEKLLRRAYRQSPAFAEDEPFALRLANTSLTIGRHTLTYGEIVSAMAKCHATIEKIRGVPTGTPSATFPNAKLRTDTGPKAPSTGTVHFSDYAREFTRLAATHS